MALLVMGTATAAAVRNGLHERKGNIICQATTDRKRPTRVLQDGTALLGIFAVSCPGRRRRSGTSGDVVRVSRAKDHPYTAGVVRANRNCDSCDLVRFRNARKFRSRTLSKQVPEGSARPGRRQVTLSRWQFEASTERRMLPAAPRRSSLIQKSTSPSTCRFS
jgi:hypothetical protein